MNLNKYNTLFEKKTLDFCKNGIQHAQLGESRYIVFIREISLLKSLKFKQNQA